jgi:putative NADPH-quinone reductase
MKKLVVLTHPDIESSKVNKRWLQEAQNLTSEFTIHQLHKVYGAGESLDVKLEQEQLLEHQAVILQFPLYWFGTPPLLKKWLDEVLLPGFAYGRKKEDRQLTGKRFGFAISAGIKNEDYRREGRYHYTLEELLLPLAATISYIDAQYVAPFVLYGAEYDPTNPEIDDISQEIDDSANAYVEYLRKI